MAGFLQGTYGYQVITLSQRVKELAEEYGLDPSQHLHLQDAGNRARDGGHADCLAQWAIDQVDPNSEYVVLDALRNVAEVVALRRHFARFFLLGVDADFSVRRERAEHLGMSREEFVAIDTRDSGEDSVVGQQVRLCMGFADAIVRNNDHVADFGNYIQTEKLRQDLGRLHNLFAQEEAGEPSPDELLMGIADDSALQSRCLRRQVGAVLCTDLDDGQEVLSVGRNNPPPTEAPCKIAWGQCYREKKRNERVYRCDCGNILDAVLCPECKGALDRRELSGKELDYCRSLHAEEHAILQLAKRPGGIPAGTHMYTTTFPCFMCAKKIAAMGIKRVVYADPYPVEEAAEVLKNAGVKLEPFQGIRSKAFHRVFTRPPALAADVIKRLSAEAEDAVGHEVQGNAATDDVVQGA